MPQTCTCVDHAAHSPPPGAGPVWTTQPALPLGAAPGSSSRPFLKVTVPLGWLLTTLSLRYFLVPLGVSCYLPAVTALSP